VPLVVVAGILFFAFDVTEETESRRPESRIKRGRSAERRRRRIPIFLKRRSSKA
jgi:hypothetical protein